MCVCMCSPSRQGREQFVYLDNNVLFFSLRELLQSTGYHDIFQEEMGFDLVVFRGLLRRRKSCKMTCLDLRGFKLSKLRSWLGLWSIIVVCLFLIHVVYKSGTSVSQRVFLFLFFIN